MLDCARHTSHCESNFGSFCRGCPTQRSRVPSSVSWVDSSRLRSCSVAASRLGFYLVSLPSSRLGSGPRLVASSRVGLAGGSWWLAVTGWCIAVSLGGRVDSQSLAVTRGGLRRLAANRVKVSVNGAVVLDEDEKALHDLWEATSFELDKLQWNPACAEQEQEGLKKRHKPAWKLTYEPRATPAEWLANASKYRVAIIREEGSNGECEVVVKVAGFEPWDVHVRDLLSGSITLEGFLFRVLVGGFSYADVLESARG
ncbi:hypothetical protein BLSTO_04674 [Blastocystis sp. subtype 1]